MAEGDLDTLDAAADLVNPVEQLLALNLGPVRVAEDCHLVGLLGNRALVRPAERVRRREVVEVALVGAVEVRAALGRQLVFLR